MSMEMLGLTVASMFGLTVAWRLRNVAAMEAVKGVVRMDAAEMVEAVAAHPDSSPCATPQHPIQTHHPSLDDELFNL